MFVEERNKLRFHPYINVLSTVLRVSTFYTIYIYIYIYLFIYIYIILLYTS